MQANVANDNLRNLRLDVGYDEFNKATGVFLGDDVDKLDNKNDVNASDSGSSHIFYTRLFLMRRDIQ
jgi:hypothetical protein